MIKLPSDVQHSDVQQWLNDGVFFVKVRKEWELGRYRDSNERDDGTPYVEVVMQRDDTRRKVSREDIRAHWPLCGAINLDGSAYHIERRSVRQWGRTFRASHAYVHSIRRSTGEEVSMVRNNRGQGFTTDMLQALFCPVYPENLAHALSMFERTTQAVALNRHIILHIYNGSVHVMHNTAHVGTVNRDTMEFTGDRHLVHTKRIEHLLAVSG